MRSGPHTILHEISPVLTKPCFTSQIVKDFLMHCFQKDVNLRISARKLSRHPWMMSARKQLEQMRPAGMGAAGAGSALKGDRMGTGYDEAVKSVQQWNEALKGKHFVWFRKLFRAHFCDKLLQSQ